MKTALCREGEFTEDGRLLVDLPPELPRGRVMRTPERVPEDDPALTEGDRRLGRRARGSKRRRIR